MFIYCQTSGSGTQKGTQSTLNIYLFILFFHSFRSAWSGSACALKVISSGMLSLAQELSHLLLFSPDRMAEGTMAGWIDKWMHELME